MKGKRLLALLLAAVLAAGVLTACGGPGASAGVKLNTGTIEQMLETEGVTASVAADGELSAAVTKWPRRWPSAPWRRSAAWT